VLFKDESDRTLEERYESDALRELLESVGLTSVRGFERHGSIGEGARMRP